MTAEDVEGHIVQTPGVCGGQFRVANTRIPVLTIFGAFRDGWSVDTILEQFPSTHLTREVVEECIRFTMRPKPRKEARQRARRPGDG